MNKNISKIVKKVLKVEKIGYGKYTNNIFSTDYFDVLIEKDKRKAIYNKEGDISDMYKIRCIVSSHEIIDKDNDIDVEIDWDFLEKDNIKEIMYNLHSLFKNAKTLYSLIN